MRLRFRQLVGSSRSESGLELDLFSQVWVDGVVDCDHCRHDPLLIDLVLTVPLLDTIKRRGYIELDILERGYLGFLN